MRMSEAFRRDFISTGVGGVFNRIKLRDRRDTFFFEDIGANYVRMCEESGHSEDMEDIGREWMGLYFRCLLPNALKSIPLGIFLNLVVKKIWTSLGMMDHFRFSESRGVFEIVTRNEGVTRIIGRNGLMRGFYSGVLGSLYGREMEYEGGKQTKGGCIYRYRKLKRIFVITGKPKAEYDRLNRIETGRGHTMKDALRRNLFRMNGNRIYFRGKSISPIENTLFHLIGSRGIGIGSVADISEEFFGKVLKKGASLRENLVLLKNLLQVMGWGIVNSEISGNGVKISVSHPAHGLQKGGDNWDFLLHTIRGFLKAGGSEVRMKKRAYGKRRIVTEFG